MASEKICSGAAHSLAHATSNLITDQREIPVPRYSYSLTKSSTLILTEHQMDTPLCYQYRYSSLHSHNEITAKMVSRR